MTCLSWRVAVVGGGEWYTLIPWGSNLVSNVFHIHKKFLYIYILIYKISTIHYPLFI